MATNRDGLYTKDASGNVTGLQGPSGVIPLGGSLPAALTAITTVNTFAAEQDLINTQTIDTDSGNFRISGGGSGTAFNDWNSVVTTDHIFRIGVNAGIADDLGRQYLTKPSFNMTWESRYWSPGKRNVFAQEFGFRGATTNNLERRIMDLYMPYDGIEYETAFNTAQFAIGHPVSRLSGATFQRVLCDLWPNNSIYYRDIPITGTSAGSTTSAAGYAIGATQVTLASAGTGALPVDCVFQFDGVGQYYVVEVAVSNVATGGTLQFFPPLVSALSAATHTITRTAVPAPAIYHNNKAGTQWNFQLNAAGNSYLPLITYNANDKLSLPATLQPRSVNGAEDIRFQMATGTPDGSFFSGYNAAGALVFNFGSISSNTSYQGEGWLGLQTASANGAGIELRSTSGGTKSSIIQWDGANLIIRQNTGSGGTYIDSGGALNIRNWSTGGTPVAQIDQTKAAFNGVVKPPTFTVATLPSASGVGAGSRAQVSDALTPAFGATVAAGGAVFTPVYSDGTNWKVG